MKYVWSAFVPENEPTTVPNPPPPTAIPGPAIAAVVPESPDVVELFSFVAVTSSGDDVSHPAISAAHDVHRWLVVGHDHDGFASPAEIFALYDWWQVFVDLFSTACDHPVGSVIVSVPSFANWPTSRFPAVVEVAIVCDFDSTDDEPELDPACWTMVIVIALRPLTVRSLRPPLTGSRGRGLPDRQMTGPCL